MAIRFRGQQMLSSVLRFVLRLLWTAAAILLLSGLVGSMSSAEDRRKIVEAIKAASASTHTTLVLWTTVAHILLNSAHQLLTWLYNLALPVLLAIWPIAKPGLLWIWAHVHRFGVFLWPYVKEALHQLSELTVTVGTLVWERILETDPVTLGSCALLLLLVILTKPFLKWLKSRGYIDAWYGRWDGLCAAVRQRKEAVIELLKGRSRVAAAAFATVSTFIPPILIFIALILFLNRIPEASRNAFVGKAQLLLAGIFIPAVMLSRLLRNNKPGVRIIEFLQYATIVAGYILAYRALYSFPFVDKAAEYIPLADEILLSLLLWILLPSRFTGGTPTAYGMLVFFVQTNLKQVETASLQSHQEKASSFFNMALFFIPSEKREMLKSVLQDGYVLLALPFFFSPGFMARIGCLGGGYAFPIYRSIIAIRDCSVKSSASGTPRTPRLSAQSKTEDLEPCDSAKFSVICTQARYWIVFSLLSLSLEMCLGAIAGYLPFYYHIQLLVIVWLQLPYFRGAYFLHDGLYNMVLVQEKDGSDETPTPATETRPQVDSTAEKERESVEEEKAQKEKAERQQVREEEKAAVQRRKVLREAEEDVKARKTPEKTEPAESLTDEEAKKDN